MGFINRKPRTLPYQVLYALALALGLFRDDGFPRRDLSLAGVIERRAFLGLALDDAISDLDLRTDFDRHAFPADPDTDDRWRELHIFAAAKNGLMRRLS